MSKIVQFPGEFITEEDRERDRWVTVAFCATVVAGQPKDNQIEFLRATLAKFADVPDQRPPLDDPISRLRGKVATAKLGREV
jgi:hypothetical protein